MREAIIRCRERVDRFVRVVRAGGSPANGRALDGAPQTGVAPRGPQGTADGAPALPPASNESTLRLTPGWLIALGTLLVGAAQLLGLSIPALGLLLVGGGTFLAGVCLTSRGTSVVFPRPRLRRRRTACLLGAVASVGAAVALLQLLPSTFAAAPEVLVEAARQPPFWHVAVLWVIGLVSYAAAFVDDWPRGWWRRLWATHRTETLAAGGLLLLGLAVRVVRLDSFPRNFGGDEGSQALSALAVLRGTLTNMLETGWYGTPTLFYFLQAVPMAVIADPVVGSRLAPALVGVSALVVTYFLARTLYGVLVALTALAFLATYDYHVFFSRLATYHITDTFFVAATLLFAYRAVTRERWLDYALTGLMLGLGLYGYFGARILPVVLVVLFAREAITRRGWLGEAWPRLLATVAGVVLAVAPLLVHYARFPGEYNHRTNQVSVFASGWLEMEARRTDQSPLMVLASQVLRTALLFNYGPPFDIYYTPDRGLLVWPAAVAFVLGMLYALYRWRERAYFLVLVAYWLPVLGASLTEGMPQDQRIVLLAPIVALLVALGIVALARLLARCCGVPRRAALATIGVVLLATGMLSLYSYFGQWAASARYGGPNSATTTELAYYLRQLGPDAVLYLLGGRVWCQSYLTIAYLAPGARCVNVQQDQVATLTPLSAGGPVVFVALGERLDELTGLAERLGLTASHVANDDTYGLLFAAQRLPDGAATAQGEAIRSTVLRGVRTYMGALSAENPQVELSGGGWSDAAARLIGEEFAHTQAAAQAQGGWPYAELDALDIKSVRPEGPNTARVLATVVGTTSLRDADGRVMVRQRSAWQTEFFLSGESAGWRLDSVLRTGQVALVDGQASTPEDSLRSPPAPRPGN
jgi:hypothetical protein